MPWDVKDVVDRRLELVEAMLVPEVNVSRLCERFGVSAKTAYKWKHRYEADGADGLVDQSRVPRSSPNKTDLRIEGLVCDVRDEFPVWGARKLKRVLARRGVRDLPAVSTITEILRRNDRLNGLATGTVTWTRFEAEHPNDLWQMDFKGWFQTGSGRCEPFDVLDDHSRFNLHLNAYGDQQEATVKRCLSSVFGEYGMPVKVLCDNGSPWANTQAGFRWTGLGVWLVDLGIGLSHAGIRHPQTIGKDERFHRTLKLEVISTRDCWDDHAQVQEAFDRWRPIYNHQRPHDALDGDVPADRYQPSTRSMPARIEPVEYPNHLHVRKVSKQSKISFQNRRIRIGTAFVGRYVAVAPTDVDSVFDVYYRDQHVRKITLT
jgi:transposase InsO family protein